MLECSRTQTNLVSAPDPQAWHSLAETKTNLFISELVWVSLVALGLGTRTENTQDSNVVLIGYLVEVRLDYRYPFAAKKCRCSVTSRRFALGRVHTHTTPTLFQTPWPITTSCTINSLCSHLKIHLVPLPFTQTLWQTTIATGCT